MQRVHSDTARFEGVIGETADRSAARIAAAIKDLPAVLAQRMDTEIAKIDGSLKGSMFSLSEQMRQIVETVQTHLGLSAAQARQRAIELLDATGIPGAASRVDHYPHQFSGGMRQRVVIALALAAKPRLIIADEPTTALDVSIQAQIIALIRQLCREQGTAVMLVTHDMGVIAETCDRVAVMYAGRVAEIGPVHEVINHPAHPYTAGLMAAIPDMSVDNERLFQIDGAMPRLNAIPKGCAFNPRCNKVIDRCRQERPDLIDAGVTRAACWLHEVKS